MKYQLIVTAKGGTAHDVVVCDKLPVEHDVRLARDGHDGQRPGLLDGRRPHRFPHALPEREGRRGRPAGSLTNNSTATSRDAGRAKAHATINVPAKHGVKGKLKRTAGVTG